MEKKVEKTGNEDDFWPVAQPSHNLDTNKFSLPPLFFFLARFSQKSTTTRKELCNFDLEFCVSSAGY
jgi:hypothetical protein